MITSKVYIRPNYVNSFSSGSLEETTHAEGGNKCHFGNRCQSNCIIISARYLVARRLQWLSYMAVVEISGCMGYPHCVELQLQLCYLQFSCTKKGNIFSLSKLTFLTEWMTFWLTC